jgi:hypothetical protein
MNLVPNRRTGGVKQSVTRRRNRRRRNKGSLEINKAAGGYKSIVSTGAVRHLAINEYGRLMLTKAGSAYSYKIALKKESYATNYSTIDLSALINESEEFNEWCGCSNQFKIYGIRISVDYARVPEAGDTLSRLLFTVKTDKCDVLEAKIERNVMNLDMSATGVKNFNFNFNSRNTEVTHLGWTDSSEYYAGICQLKIEGQDITMLKDTTPDTVLLGTVKFSIMAKCRLRDYIPGNAKTTMVKKKKLELYQTSSGILDKEGHKYELKPVKEEEDEKSVEDEEELQSQLEAFKGCDSETNELQSEQK